LVVVIWNSFRASYAEQEGGMWICFEVRQCGHGQK
jgi:hypothetical protein